MADDPVLSFDPLRILRQLRDDGVEFVLIGGIAGRIHGSPTVTNDLDICYRRTIRMKQAAGRSKDLIEVEVLKAVLATSRESQSPEY